MTRRWRRIEPKPENPLYGIIITSAILAGLVVGWIASDLRQPFDQRGTANVIANLR